MRDHRFEIAGLVGFILSGLIFLANAVGEGDTGTVVGSIVWIVACGLWLVPLVRR